MVDYRPGWFDSLSRRSPICRSTRTFSTQHSKQNMKAAMNTEEYLRFTMKAHRLVGMPRISQKTRSNNRGKGQQNGLISRFSLYLFSYYASYPKRLITSERTHSPRTFFERQYCGPNTPLLWYCTAYCRVGACLARPLFHSAVANAGGSSCTIW